MSARRTLYWCLLGGNLGSLIGGIGTHNLVGALSGALGIGALLVSWPRGDS